MWPQTDWKWWSLIDRHAQLDKKGVSRMQSVIRCCQSKRLWEWQNRKSGQQTAGKIFCFDTRLTRTMLLHFRTKQHLSFDNKNRIKESIRSRDGHVKQNRKCDQLLDNRTLRTESASHFARKTDKEEPSTNTCLLEIWLSSLKELLSR